MAGPAELDAQAAAMEAGADYCVSKGRSATVVRTLYESAAAFAHRAACERDRRATWDAAPRDENGEPC